MLVTEEELAIEVAKVDGIEVDDVDLAKAGEDEILEKLAAYAASADHQDARLEKMWSVRESQRKPNVSHLLDFAVERAQALLCEAFAPHDESAEAWATVFMRWGDKIRGWRREEDVARKLRFWQTRAARAVKRRSEVSPVSHAHFEFSWSRSGSASRKKPRSVPGHVIHSATRSHGQDELGFEAETAFQRHVSVSRDLLKLHISYSLVHRPSLHLISNHLGPVCYFSLVELRQSVVTVCMLTIIVRNSWK